MITIAIAACASMAGSAAAQENPVLLGATTAGPGTLTVSPTGLGPGEPGVACRVEAQSVTTGGCDYAYAPGTRVTVTAQPDSGASFAGWSDYTCRKSSRTCTLTMSDTRYITARFNPVTVAVSSFFPEVTSAAPFGDITVTPAPGGLCRLTPDTPPCAYSYKQGALVSLRRQHGAPGLFWIGACQGNVEGKLDATVCRIRLRGDEQVGAGYDNVAAIPPPRGSGIAVVVSSKKRGKVTGRVVSGGETLNCGARCTVTGVTRYDSIRLTATAMKGSRFVRWSDGSKQRKRIVQFSNVNRIKATFARSRHR